MRQSSYRYTTSIHGVGERTLCVEVHKEHYEL